MDYSFKSRSLIFWDFIKPNMDFQNEYVIETICKQKSGVWQKFLNGLLSLSAHTSGVIVTMVGLTIHQIVLTMQGNKAAHMFAFPLSSFLFFHSLLFCIQTS